MAWFDLQLPWYIFSRTDLQNESDVREISLLTIDKYELLIVGNDRGCGMAQLNQLLKWIMKHILKMTLEQHVTCFPGYHEISL